MNLPSLISEIISLLASITLLFQRGTSWHLKLFIPLLLLTILVEITGWLLMSKGYSNFMLYNLFSTVEFEVYLLVLRSFIYNSIFRKAIIVLLWIYPAMVLVNISFVQIGTFHTFTYSIGCLIVVAICIFYFLELFRLPKAIKLTREPAFWICSGLLFFYCCSFPVLGLINYMNVNEIPVVILQNIGIVLMFLSIIHYTLFTIAFLCRIKVRSLAT